MRGSDRLPMEQTQRDKVVPWFPGITALLALHPNVSTCLTHRFQLWEATHRWAHEIKAVGPNKHFK